VISVDGQTRSSTIILDTGANQETQITEAAENILRQDIHLVVDLLKENLSEGDIVVLAGHLPSGLATDVYRWLTAEAKNLGAEVVLAAGGEPLKKAITAKPNLVIVKKQELESYFNIPVRDYTDVLECANRLKQEGALRVLVNIPDEGKALLVSQESHNLVNFREAIHGHSLPSTSSGIFEAFIAGYLMGKFQYESLPESLEFSAAAAMYTATQVGHEFGEQDEVEEFLPEAKIEEDSETNPKSN
jgi:fructose-1-phosphate kinase PfkB-like protein